MPEPSTPSHHGCREAPASGYPAAVGPPVTAESWSYLDPEVLLASRSVRVCMTCHFFRHHATASGIPLLACHHHGGLITHGEHLTRRCRQWSPDPMARIGWAPEAA